MSTIQNVIKDGSKGCDQGLANLGCGAVVVMVVFLLLAVQAVLVFVFLVWCVLVVFFVVVLLWPCFCGDVWCWYKRCNKTVGK